jgi:hypothetical protein
MLAASSGAVKASRRAYALFSKWGVSDERGPGSHMKPQTVINAAKLIKTDEAIELGHESLLLSYKICAFTVLFPAVTSSVHASRQTRDHRRIARKPAAAIALPQPSDPPKCATLPSSADWRTRSGRCQQGVPERRNIHFSAGTYRDAADGHTRSPALSRPTRRRARVTILPISRTHSTELATAPQNSQSVALKLVVENASCRKGV